MTSCAKKRLQSNVGRVFGTYYSFAYYATENYETDFDSIFTLVNKSLSTFDSTSIIYNINHSDGPVAVNEYFETVYGDALYVSQQTDGALDLTVAPLVNLWGFGYDPQDTSTYKSKTEIDSIMEFVGYNKISIKDGMLVKEDGRTKLDASAVAKGYACDLVAEFLLSKGVDRFLVDIGGEMVAHGKNPNNEYWRIGVVSPVDDATQTNNECEFAIQLKDKAIATSGNYRQFYVTKERKVSHTIDPRTGYPVDKKVLSATVISPRCSVADAYATSFMVVGDTTKIKDIIKASKYELEAYIIVDENGTHVTRHYLNAQ